MNNRRMKVLSAAAVSAIAIGTIGFMGGCKSQEVLKERPFIPAPAMEPSAPAAAPAVMTPMPAPVEPPAPVVIKPVPEPIVVPK